jgi:hypothetical protein
MGIIGVWFWAGPEWTRVDKIGLTISLSLLIGALGWLFVKMDEGLKR